MINLHHIDNMAFMKDVPDKFYDLAIVDPPYGIGESKKVQSRPLKAKQKNGTYLYVTGARKHKVSDWDNKRPDPEYFVELQRISKNQIIWGGNHMADLLPARSGWIVWDKLNSESDQSDCELAWTSFKCGCRKVEYLWNGFLQGREDNGRVAQGNKKLNEKRIHPTQKPVYVYKWLLNNYAEKGDKIFDSHSGSASLAIACEDYGFSLDACEIDEDYFKAAQKRLQQHQSQLTLIP